MQIVRAYQRTQGRRQRKENSRGRLATTFPFQYFLILPNSLKSTKQWKAEAVPSWDICWLTFFASMCECDALMTEIYFVLWPFLLSMIDHHLYIFSLIVRSPGLLECVVLIAQRSVVRIFYLVWVEKYVIECHNYIHCRSLSWFLCLSCCALWLRWGVSSPSQD